jgi:hypothetical protein
MLPDRLWICGLSNTAEAVRRLSAFRAQAFGDGKATQEVKP